MENQLKEQLKSAERYQNYKALIAYPEWKYFIEDMKEIVRSHELASVQYSQNNMNVDARKQAFIVMGIQECLDQPKDFIEHHETFFQKVKREVCRHCGNLFQMKAA